MKIIGIILIVLGIIVAIGIYQSGGWASYKENIFGNSIQSTKSIFNTGKNVVGYIQGENATQDLVEVGMIPCKTNEDCIILDECANGACTCYTDGICYKRGD